jgi:hypothetical protein
MDPEWVNRTDLRLIRLETRIAGDEVHRGNVSERLAKIEDMLKWVVRLIIGAFLISAVTFVIQGGLAIV